MALLLALATAASVAYANSLNLSLAVQNTAQFTSDIILCNSSFASANATGIFHTTTEFGATYGAALAFAQSQRPGAGYGLQASLLYQPPYTTRSACGISINVGAIQPNTWLRAQYDNGSCLSTFDATCVADLKAAVNAIANDSCDNIYAQVSNIVPSSCMPYLQPGITFTNGYDTFTGDGGALEQACKMNGSWYNVLTLVGTYSDTNYDQATGVVWPLMNVFNGAQPSTDLVCLHINNFNNGSRVAPPLATPTPVVITTPSKGLSGGAIAGIVVAVLALLGLIALGVWFFMTRPKKQEMHAHRRSTDIFRRSMDVFGHRKYSEVAGTSISELDTWDRKEVELPSEYHVQELRGDMHYELPGGNFFHELPAESVEKIK